MDQAFQKLLWYLPRNLLAFLLKKLFMAIYGTCTTDPFYSFTFERWWWSWEVVVADRCPSVLLGEKKKSSYEGGIGRPGSGDSTPSLLPPILKVMTKSCSTSIWGTPRQR